MGGWAFTLVKILLNSSYERVRFLKFQFSDLSNFSTSSNSNEKIQTNSNRASVVSSTIGSNQQSNQVVTSPVPSDSAPLVVEVSPSLPPSVNTSLSTTNTKSDFEETSSTSSANSLAVTEVRDTSSTSSSSTTKETVQPSETSSTHAVAPTNEVVPSQVKEVDNIDHSNDNSISSTSSTLPTVSSPTPDPTPSSIDSIPLLTPTAAPPTNDQSSNSTAFNQPPDSSLVLNPQNNTNSDTLLRTKNIESKTETVIPSTNNSFFHPQITENTGSSSSAVACISLPEIMRQLETKELEEKVHFLLQHLAIVANQVAIFKEKELTQQSLVVKLSEDLRMKEKQYDILRGKQKIDFEKKLIAEEKLAKSLERIKELEQESNAKDKNIRQLSKKLKKLRSDWIKSPQVNEDTSQEKSALPKPSQNYIKSSLPSIGSSSYELDMKTREIKKLQEAVWAHQQQNSDLAKVNLKTLSFSF